MTALSLWTIYARPAEHPDHYVVRRWEVTAAGPKPCPDIVVVGDLDTARRRVPEGLHRLPRSAGDDPVIVETWL